MDDRQLRDLLKAGDIPPPDENARKEAVNLAMAAFDDAQKENRDRSQGSSLLGRLTGQSKPRDGRRPMNRKLIYGGMATATVALVAVASVQVAQDYLEAQRQAMFSSVAKQKPPPKTETRSATAKTERDNLVPERYGSTDQPGPTAAGRSGARSPAEKEVFRDSDGSRAPVGNLQRGTRETSADELARSAPPAPPPRAEPKPLSAQAPKPVGRALNESVGQFANVPALKKADRAARLRADGKASSSGYRPLSQLRSSTENRVVIAPGEKRIFHTPADVQPKPQYEAVGRDQFQAVEQNAIKRVAVEPVSTFSIDVDTASYSFMRRRLNQGVLPQKNSVRVEELINYFDYDYPLAGDRERPFQTNVTVTPSPWKKGNKLIRIGIRGYDIDADEKPRSNLVFLLDVSGSMNRPDKLPLMVNSMKLLLDTLKPDDTVAIVVYAGAAGTVLAPTKVADKRKILAALDRLRAGGSTAGAAGIRQAYALAEANLDKNAVNRVILATDGDFNVGITNRGELKGFVERKRKTGVFLSVLGFGQGNLNDHLMQTLAQNGNGVAAHIDTLNEARKVLVEEASSTLFPIAKDVKIQVEFNPKTVAEYRLIGYETRALKREDFNNDKVDAGDIGAGHTVTAIYEITPVAGGTPMIGTSRYQQAQRSAEPKSDFANEYAFLKIRYKLPKSETSTLIATPITTGQEIAPDADTAAARETRWATAVASFGQLLKGGKYTGTFSYDDVIVLARSAKGPDEFGYRAEFINLVRLARSAAALPKR